MDDFNVDFKRPKRRLKTEFKASVATEGTNGTSTSNITNILSDNGEQIKAENGQVSKPKVPFNTTEQMNEEFVPVPSGSNQMTSSFKEEATYGLEKFKNNLLIIFNQENIKGYKPRAGTEKDVTALEKTFSKFGFKTVKHKDLSRREIKNQLKVFEDKNFNDYGCVAVAVLTHGTNNGLIKTRQGQLNEVEIINSFKTYNKPTLVSKPKILIVQACRGYKILPPVQVSGPGTSRKHRDEDLEQFYTLPVEGDMLILHSSYIGSPSFRHEKKGSWFIQALCRKINKLASKLDLESIVTEVKREVAIKLYYTELNRRTGEIEIMKQMPMLTSTLVRKLYLRKYDGTNQSADDGDFSSCSTSGPAASSINSEECLCFLDHYSYIMKCLRNIVKSNPDDMVARTYLHISKTFKESNEFNDTKKQLAKTICQEYFSNCSKDKSYYKFVYMYKNELKK